MSAIGGFRLALRAAFAMSAASRSQLPDSLANGMVVGSADRAGAPGSCAFATDAAPARKPASQARCVGLAGPTTRLSRSISSSWNGALFGMVAKLAGIALRPKTGNQGCAAKTVPGGGTIETPSATTTAIDIGALPGNARQHAEDDEQDD